MFLSQYGPAGEQRNRLDTYYNDLGGYLAANSADVLAQTEADSIAS